MWEGLYAPTTPPLGNAHVFDPPRSDLRYSSCPTLILAAGSPDPALQILRLSASIAARRGPLGRRGLGRNAVGFRLLIKRRDGGQQRDQILHASLPGRMR